MHQAQLVVFDSDSPHLALWHDQSPQEMNCYKNEIILPQREYYNHYQGCNSV